METSLIEQVTAKVASLPLEQQREALALIESLEKRIQGSSAPRALRLKGVTAGPGPNLTLEDLKEERKEMWGEYVGSGK
ncbi:MAG: hypothetical protein AB7P14_14610 [Blastocatellales bacterium]